MNSGKFHWVFEKNNVTYISQFHEGSLSYEKMSMVQFQTIKIA